MNVLKPAEITMTPEEAEAIVRRFMERESAPVEGPRVADLAEALRVSPEEVASMLAEVRSAPLPKRKRRVVRRERRLWILTGLAALLVGALAIVGMQALHWGPFEPSIVVRVSRSATHSASPVYGATGKGAYELFLDGEPIGNSKYIGEQTGRLRDGLFDWVDGALPDPSIRAVSREEDVASRKALQKGNWDGIVGIRFAPLEIRKGDETGWLRWAGISGTVPLYEGDDALIAEAVRNERNRRVLASLDAALGGLTTE